MEHRAFVARRIADVPSPWTTICIVGAPSQHHRARCDVRLGAEGTAVVDLPVFLAEAATRLQIEIVSAWPAIVAIESAELRESGTSPFAVVPASRFHLYNAQRIAADGALSALCVAGTMVWQIDGVEGLANRDGARLRMHVRRTSAAPLSSGDAAMAEFARPERAVRAGIARLATRIGALAR